MDAPSHLGTFVGIVRRLRRDRSGLEITLDRSNHANPSRPFDRSLCRSDDRSLGCSIDCSHDRSDDRSHDCSLDRSDDRSHDCSLDRSDDRSLGCSIDRSHDRSDDRSLDRSDDRSLGRHTRPERVSTYEAELHNGDGFAFINGSSVTGFRGDVCEGNTIRCKEASGLREGMRLYRNIDAAFERELERNLPKREIPVSITVSITGRWNIALTAASEDGRTVTSSFKADVETAENRQRAAAMFREQLSKRSGHYIFTVGKLEAGELPLLSASTLNSMRRLLADDLDSIPCNRIPMAGGASSSVKPGSPSVMPDSSSVMPGPIGHPTPPSISAAREATAGFNAPLGGSTSPARSAAAHPSQAGAWAPPSTCAEGGSPLGGSTSPARSAAAHPSQAGTWAPLSTCAEGGSPLGGSTSPARPLPGPLMRTRYCIRYELGLCPVHQGAKDTGPLFLVNNGRRLALGFDCRSCEMTVSDPSAAASAR